MALTIEEKIAKYYLRSLLVCIVIFISTLCVCGLLSLCGIISSEAAHSILMLLVMGLAYISIGTAFLVLLLVLYVLWNIFDE